MKTLCLVSRKVRSSVRCCFCSTADIKRICVDTSARKLAVGGKTVSPVETARNDEGTRQPAMWCLRLSVPCDQSGGRCREVLLLHSATAWFSCAWIIAMSFSLHCRRLISIDNRAFRMRLHNLSPALISSTTSSHFF